MKGPIQSLEVSYLVHATEDAAKIEGAVSALLGLDPVTLTEDLEGHFGNAIVRARVHLTGDDAERGFRHLAKALPKALADEVASDASPYVDEHSALFLRLDKQRLVSGSVVSGAGDAVRVKVKPRGFVVRGSASAFYRGLLGRK